MNAHAKQLKALHQPGTPLVLANVYDILSAEAVAALPGCKALATASYAVAAASGISDSDLTLETNLAAVRGIANVASKYKIPLTVDIQDGYGDELEPTIKYLISFGVSGINLEDCDKVSQKMYSPEIAVKRIKSALSIARREGVADFVINARCDTLVTGGDISEVLTRGRLYLEAGATTVFVWGGSKRGVSRDEVVEMVNAFEGRLNVSLKMAPGNLTVKELAKLGVARISVGPALQFAGIKAISEHAGQLLNEVP
jgi:2-methylisocitrate lyase-like PEP mutase family enzyme